MRLGRYEGDLRDAVLETKRRADRASGAQLGRLLAASMRSSCQAEGVSPQDIAIVPVPISRRRQWLGGIQHTLAIARGLRQTTGAPIVRAIRAAHGPRQTSLSASARARNVRGRFHATRGVRRLTGTRVIVVLDDIRTTGATLRSACRAVRRGMADAGIWDRATMQIWAAAVLITPERARRATDQVAGSAESPDV